MPPGSWPQPLAVFSSWNAFTCWLTPSPPCCAQQSPQPNSFSQLAPSSPLSISAFFLIPHLRAPIPLYNFLFIFYISLIGMWKSFLSVHLLPNVPTTVPDTLKVFDEQCLDHIPKETWFLKSKAKATWQARGKDFPTSGPPCAFQCNPLLTPAGTHWPSCHPSFDGAGHSRAPWGPAVMTRLSLPSTTHPHSHKASEAALPLSWSFLILGGLQKTEYSFLLPSLYCQKFSLRRA